ncbi:MAG: 5'-nucleotidase C-terminal domain-containing protein [Candidatus Methylumidiphilus sp.]
MSRKPPAFGVFALGLVCALFAAHSVQTSEPPAQLGGSAKLLFGGIAAAVSGAADANGETPLGDLTADALLWATQSATQSGAQIALVNPSDATGPGLYAAIYPHWISYAEIKSLPAADNQLVILTLTAQQIKYLLEQQFAGCGGQGGQKILQASNGFKFSWKADGPPCARIWHVAWTPVDMSSRPATPVGSEEILVEAGVVVNPDKDYRVTVNSDLADGMDGFTLLKAGARPTVVGANVADALAAYLDIFTPPGPIYHPLTPGLGKPRIVRLP